eukprot:3743625-Rhodomonas_salina.1
MKRGFEKAQRPPFSACGHVMGHVMGHVLGHVMGHVVSHVGSRGHVRLVTCEVLLALDHAVTRHRSRGHVLGHAGNALRLGLGSRV